jgi:hypothetical protein
MSIKWRETLHKALRSLRDFALTILVIGGIQVLIALLLWPIVFRDHPVGFSMALSLVGFSAWLVSFALSLADRRRQRMMYISMAGRAAPPPSQPGDRSLFDGMRDQAQRAGCGFTLLAASLVPLGVAFILRLRYDLRSGLTLRDILPPMP